MNFFEAPRAKSELLYRIMMRYKNHNVTFPYCCFHLSNTVNKSAAILSAIIFPLRVSVNMPACSSM